MENKPRDPSANDLVLLGRRTLQKEAEALSAFVETLDLSFAQVAELIFKCEGAVLLTGMGKSGLVARKWASTFSGTGTKSYFINPAEASHGDLGILRAEDILIALSYSGETEELSPILRYAKESQIPTIGVTGNLQSSLAKQSELTLSVYLSEEACPLGLAPTSSTTLMMALGDALASTLMQMRGFTEKDFARLHPGGSLGRKLWLRVSELMHTGNAIPKIFSDDTFEKILIEMTRKCLGLAVVVDKANPNRSLGLITDGDLRRCLQRGRGFESVLASDIMTTKPKSILASALAVEAREMMETHMIHHLLVSDTEENLVGVLHFDDLLRRKVL